VTEKKRNPSLTKDSYPPNSEVGLVAVPLALIMVPVALIILPAAHSRLYEVMRKGRANTLLRATLIYFLVTGVAASFKYWMKANYYLCSLPFLACLCGSVAEVAMKDRIKRGRARLARAAVLFTLSLVVGAFWINVKAKGQDHPVRSLDNQIRFLHELERWLVANHLRLGGLEEIHFRPASDGPECAYVSRACFEGLADAYLPRHLRAASGCDYEVLMMHLKDEPRAIQIFGGNAPPIARWSNANVVFYLYPMGTMTGAGCGTP